MSQKGLKNYSKNEVRSHFCVYLGHFGVSLPDSLFSHIAITHTKITKLIPKQFRLVIPPPKLPKIVLKHFGKVDRGVRKSTALNDYQDLLNPETILFGDCRTEIAEINSKIMKFGSVLFLCVVVQAPIIRNL